MFNILNIYKLIDIDIYVWVAQDIFSVLHGISLKRADYLDIGCQIWWFLLSVTCIIYLVLKTGSLMRSRV